MRGMGETADEARAPEAETVALTPLPPPLPPRRPPPLLPQPIA